MATRNYKYKLYVTKHTKKLSQLVTSSNFAWNHVVAFARRYYKIYGKSLSSGDLQKHMAKLRKKDHFWCKLGSQTMQAICQKYSDALNKHFTHGRGFPRPHKRFGTGSFVFKQTAGYKLRVGENADGKPIGLLTVNSLGKHRTFKFKVTRPWGDVKNITIMRDTDNTLYLVITCDVEIETIERKEDKGPIGMDFGLKTFLTLSDGSSRDIPDFTKQQHKKVALADRAYSIKRNVNNHTKIWGSNFKRAKRAKAKAHRKEQNLRSEFHWKLAHELCKEHSLIAIEDLNLEGMKKLWGRKVSNQGYGEFVQKLLVVAEKYGTKVIKVGRYFASSQTCSECGYVYSKTKDLNVREWICPQCGSVHDRDVNAAKNILREALSDKETKGKDISPCGRRGKSPEDIPTAQRRNPHVGNAA